MTLWTFWDSYESAIHKNDELADVDKFNYLHSLLERTTHEAIAGLTLSAANYHEDHRETHGHVAQHGAGDLRTQSEGSQTSAR